MMLYGICCVYKVSLARKCQPSDGWDIICSQLGLNVDLWTIDVASLQKHPQFPGMEVDRSKNEAIGLVGTWQGTGGGDKSRDKRFVFNGHIDVVPEGDPANWKYDPWGAELVDGRIYGRGACDMKGGLMAALYAIKAIMDTDIPIQWLFNDSECNW